MRLLYQSAPENTYCPQMNNLRIVNVSLHPLKLYKLQIIKHREADQILTSD